MNISSGASGAMLHWIIRIPNITPSAHKGWMRSWWPWSLSTLSASNICILLSSILLLARCRFINRLTAAGPDGEFPQAQTMNSSRSTTARQAVHSYLYLTSGMVACLFFGRIKVAAADEIEDANEMPWVYTAEHIAILSTSSGVSILEVCYHKQRVKFCEFMILVFGSVHACGAHKHCAGIASFVSLALVYQNLSDRMTIVTLRASYASHFRFLRIHVCTCGTWVMIGAGLCLSLVCN